MAGAERHPRAGGRRAAEARELVVVGEADAEVAALGAQLRLLRAERLVVERLDDLREADGIGPGVVDEARGGGVRQVVRRHEVDPTDLHGIEVEGARAEIEQALHHERRRRPRHAAIRPGGRRVRRHRADLAAVVLELVGPREQAADHQRLDPRRPRKNRIRPGVAERPRIERAQPTVGVEADANRVVMVARVRAGQEVLAALLDPLHRAAESHGQQA